MTLIDDKKHQFENALEHLHEELKNIRTGRASPALVENLMVDYYGTKTPLLQIASISAPDPRSLVIQPWDKSVMPNIEKTIRTSPLGLNPVNEGTAIRLPIPPLTEERRQELVKVVHQRMEEAKVSLRNVRENIWRTLRDQKKDGAISEDDMFLQQKELQKIIEANNEKIKEAGEVKEKEIMTI